MYIVQKKYIRGCKKDKTYNVSTHSFIYKNNTWNITVFTHKSLQTCIYVCPIQMSTFIKSDQSAPNLLRTSPISRSGFVHPDQRVITGLTCSYIIKTLRNIMYILHVGRYRPSLLLRMIPTPGVTEVKVTNLEFHIKVKKFTFKFI